MHLTAVAAGLFWEVVGVRSDFNRGYVDTVLFCDWLFYCVTVGGLGCGVDQIGVTCYDVLHSRPCFLRWAPELMQFCTIRRIIARMYSLGLASFKTKNTPSQNNKVQ